MIKEKAVPTVKPQASKSITVSLIDKNKPEFQFVGEWSGRDILVVSKHLFRAYKLKQLAVRRSLAVSEQKEVLAAKG